MLGEQASQLINHPITWNFHQKKKKKLTGCWKQISTMRWGIFGACQSLFINSKLTAESFGLLIAWWEKHDPQSDLTWRPHARPIPTTEKACVRTAWDPKSTCGHADTYELLLWSRSHGVHRGLCRLYMFSGHVPYLRGWASATVTEQLLMACTKSAQQRGVAVPRARAVGGELIVV